MEGLRRCGGALWWMTMAVAMLTCAVCGQKPNRHNVGGTKGWNPGVNYTEWSIHEQFYVGDWLYFGFDKRYYTVLEVNKTNYENCIDKNFIFNITKGGRDVFELKQARPYYFLSSGGYCFNGMKLAVNVEVYLPPAPAPAPAQNNGHMNARPPTFLDIARGVCLGLALLLGAVISLAEADR